MVSSIVSIVCLMAIIILAIPCNVFAIVFVFAVRRKPTMKDKVIAVLCSINLLQVVAYTIELHAAFSGDIGSAACEVSAFTVCFSTYASIGCFVILMLERYTSIVYPFKYVAWFSSNIVKACCLLCPVIYGFILGTPPLFGWGAYGRSRPNATYCGFDFIDNVDSDRTYFYSVVAISFGLPLLMTIICFGHIIFELRRTAMLFKRQYGRASTISRASNKTVHEQCISSLLTATIYIASWLPYSIVCFLFYIGKKPSISFELCAIYMAKSCTVTSPLIFCLIEKRVRRFMQKDTPVMCNSPIHRVETVRLDQDDANTFQI